MPIYVGSKQMGDLRVGGNKIQSVYVGGKQVYIANQEMLYGVGITPSAQIRVIVLNTDNPSQSTLYHDYTKPVGSSSWLRIISGVADQNYIYLFVQTTRAFNVPVCFRLSLDEPREAIQMGGQLGAADNVYSAFTLPNGEIWGLDGGVLYPFHRKSGKFLRNGSVSVTVYGGIAIRNYTGIHTYTFRNTYSSAVFNNRIYLIYLANLSLSVIPFLISIPIDFYNHLVEDTNQIAIDAITVHGRHHNYSSLNEMEGYKGVLYYYTSNRLETYDFSGGSVIDRTSRIPRNIISGSVEYNGSFVDTRAMFSHPTYPYSDQKKELYANQSGTGAPVYLVDKNNLAMSTEIFRTTLVIFSSFYYNGDYYYISGKGYYKFDFAKGGVSDKLGDIDPLGVTIPCAAGFGNDVYYVRQFPDRSSSIQRLPNFDTDMRETVLNSLSDTTNVETQVVALAVDATYIYYGTRSGFITRRLIESPHTSVSRKPLTSTGGSIAIITGLTYDGRDLWGIVQNGTVYKLIYGESSLIAEPIPGTSLQGGFYQTIVSNH